MMSSQDKLFSKKNLISFLLLAILILAIPLIVRLVQQQTQIKSKAASGNEITFPDLRKDERGNFVTKSPQIKILLDSPFGPPTAQTRTQ